MEKRNGLAIALFVLLLLNVISASADNGFDSGTVEGDAEKIINATSKLKEFSEKEKWEFLAEEWKELLLKNKIIAGINSFLEKISIVFLIFFGKGYEFSPLFFMTIFIWLFHFWLFGSFILGLSHFKGGIKAVVGLGIVIVLSHLGYINFVTEIALNIMLWGEGIWRWISTFIVIFGVIFLVVFMKSIRKKINEAYEKKKKEQEEHDRETLHTMAEGVREGVS